MPTPPDKPKLTFEHAPPTRERDSEEEETIPAKKPEGKRRVMIRTDSIESFDMTPAAKAEPKAKKKKPPKPAPAYGSEQGSGEGSYAPSAASSGVIGSHLMDSSGLGLAVLQRDEWNAKVRLLPE